MDGFRRKPSDINKLAASIVASATDERTEDERLAAQGKDPAAVRRGRAGGLKGGLARSEKLDSERRHEIAKRAAEARWR